MGAKRRLVCRIGPPSAHARSLRHIWARLRLGARDGPACAGGGGEVARARIGEGGREGGIIIIRAAGGSQPPQVTYGSAAAHNSAAPFYTYPKGREGEGERGRELRQ